MFALTSLLAFSAVIACGRGTPTANGITVALSSPDSFDSIDDVHVVASVHNGGPADVRVLNYGGILDGNRPSRSFIISKNGIEANFTGAEYLLSMPDLPSSAYTTIPMGKTVSVDHRLAGLYDFGSLGEGDFDIAPVSELHVITANTTMAALVEVAPSSIKVSLRGNLTSTRPKEKRAKDVCNNADKRKKINAAYPSSKKLGAVARDYVKRNGKDALYKKYFGTHDTKRVVTVLDKVAKEHSNSRTMDCVGSCDPGVVAYTVFPGTNIFFCPFWFQLKTLKDMCHGYTGMTRDEALLHEFTHATSHTKDIRYGCDNDVQLPPAKAVNNADSYNCFAKSVWKKTQCN